MQFLHGATHILMDYSATKLADVYISRVSHSNKVIHLHLMMDGLEVSLRALKTNHFSVMFRHSPYKVTRQHLLLRLEMTFFLLRQNLRRVGCYELDVSDYSLDLL